jgi:trans-feruloyl-CoA hydratase/vanillin synthase
VAIVVGVNHDDPVVLVENDDGIFTVTLNRPEKRNAMNPAMHYQMHALLSDLRYNDAVRVLILTGAGGSFCSGQDLKAYFHLLEGQTMKEARDRAREISNDWRGQMLRKFPVPTIAMIEGYCIGGAFSIVTSCDIAIAADDAKFVLSEINFKTAPLGLVAKDISENIEPRQAMYYALTGEPFSGTRAAEIGLITRAVPAAELHAEVRRIAEALREKDPVALRTTKDVLKFSRRMDYEEAYAYSMALAGDLTYKQDGAWMKSGIGDFIAGKYRPGLNESKH